MVRGERGQVLTQRRAAVLGRPISHSRSPALHRAAYAGLGLDWRYEAIDVGKDDLAGFLEGLGPEWVGLSLTMPLKEVVMPLLDRVSPLAQRTRSANTVLLSDGREGHNTDVAGIVAALRPVLSSTPASAAIIGAGATARSAAAAVAELGAARLLVAARRTGPAAEVLGVAELPGEVLPWDDAARALAAELVVCTLPGDAAAALAAAIPRDPGVLLDVTYAPWPTTLAQAWSAAGGTVVAGAEMLLWQAVEQVRLMTGLDPDVAAMREALHGA